MASLNGNVIQDTYHGLIKTIDNAAAAGTAKELTDGVGNTLGIFVDTAGNFTIEGLATVEGTIDSVGGNKIAFYFANQAAFPDATTYHGAIAHSHADGKMYFAHGGSWVELALASDITTLNIDGVTIEDDATNGLQVVDNSIDSAKLASNAVDHDQLAARYTEVQTIGTTSSPLDLDASLYSVFNITANLQATQTLNLQNMKTGQVIDILATGTSTLTLTSDDTAEVFNNLGEVTYDGSANNHIQIVCLDDTDSAAIYNYSIQTYTNDNTPN
jgi:hypothetical protein